jgi:hypothetical protein
LIAERDEAVYALPLLSRLDLADPKGLLHVLSISYLLRVSRLNIRVDSASR